MAQDVVLYLVQLVDFVTRSQVRARKLWRRLLFQVGVLGSKIVLWLIYIELAISYLKPVTHESSRSLGARNVFVAVRLHVVAVSSGQPRQVKSDLRHFRFEPSELPSLIQNGVRLLLHRANAGKTRWLRKSGL